MKSATVTFHRALNYGAVLQTYALNQAIRSLGAENEVLDYRCLAIEKPYAFPCLRDFRYPRSALLKLLSLKKYRSKAGALERFLRENGVISPKALYNKAQLETACASYGALICGSDQIWNPLLTGNDEVYWLNFAPKGCRKIAYAASFGKNAPSPARNKEIAATLNDFYAVSVRELSGLNYLHEAGVINAQLVPDPVFLLTRDDWIALARTTETDPYILIYELAGIPNTRKRASAYAQKHGMKVICISNETFGEKNDCLRLPDADVNTFLGLVASAQAVITNSFHGSAISIILRKPLFIVGKDDARLEYLLEQFSMQEHLFTEGDPLVFPSVDWDSVEKTRNRIRSVGFDFLKDAIKD